MVIPIRNPKHRIEDTIFTILLFFFIFNTVNKNKRILNMKISIPKKEDVRYLKIYTNLSNIVNSNSITSFTLAPEYRLFVLYHYLLYK